MAPDRTGAAAGGTKTYTFTASRRGHLPVRGGAAAQRPAPGRDGALRRPRRPSGDRRAGLRRRRHGVRRRGRAGAQRDRPRAEQLANPANFDMRNYAPRYFLINGKAYPDTDPIPTAAGSGVLLRYVNAGNQYHSMSLLGAHQTRHRPRRQPAELRTPLRRGDVRPRPDRGRHRHGAELDRGHAPCRSTTAACCCTTATPAGVRRDAHLPRRHGLRVPDRTTPRVR